MNAKRLFPVALILAVAMLARTGGAAQVTLTTGGHAGDFPPGTFSDGNSYSLDDFRGKLVVLFFYEKECPTCRGLIPTRNAVVEQFRDSPVVFIAVGPNDTLADVRAYQKETGLEMLSYPDSLGAMEAHYGFHISLQNIYQFRYIGPDGKVMNGGTDFTSEAVQNALKKVKWKYKDSGFDPKLNNIVQLLEWNQYVPAVRQLRPLTKTKSTAEAANKLYASVTAEGQRWLDEADKASKSEPAEAFGLYSKVSAVFQGDELAKKADAALKDLKKSKPVQDELAARVQYQQLYQAMSRATARQRDEVIQFCQSISSQYASTPTGKKAAQLAKDLLAAEKMKG